MRTGFAAVRVRPAHRNENLHEARPEEWLLADWPSGEPQPRKYWLSTDPEDVSLQDLVQLAELRWRIDRDCQDMKSELGLGHFEGRNWLGFHHHGTFCIAAYAFLAAERARLSPQSLLPASSPLDFPRISGRRVQPLRAERLVASPVATLRIVHAGRLARTLASCPWCGTDQQHIVL
jgi:hypothetical protein